MALIKRLYVFILKSFLPLFAMTFFIVLFIVLMQFLWKHIDDLVGKGLPISLIGELFFYAGVSMVPMALPLAILLASLMTFGNFGEKFELTAMKASGISLLHAMRPLFIFIAFISVGAFFFQNDVLPPAQVKMWTLLFSMRQKSPEVEIPEGVFYDQIPGYNLLVQRKDRETGMLYDMMIYDVTRGGDNATILMADSARMAFTGDMRYLYLHLFSGEQFENLREQRSLDKNVPFRRESFQDKEVLIPFDANFNRLDEGGMRSQYIGKNMAELRHTIDSIDNRLDSTGNIYAKDLQGNAFPLLIDRTGARRIQDQTETAKDTAAEDIKPIDLDSLIHTLDSKRRIQLFENAMSFSRRQVNEYQFKSLTVEEDKKQIRRHEIELLKKYTLSVACLIFFFIGAPLGAIIRKGGLGTPLVISVLLFLFYYIIDNTGYKMARDGHWAVWFGIWLSTFILTPLGIYVTYKAMNDSSVFDADRYKSLLRKLTGKRPERSVTNKEVIINEISENEALNKLKNLISLSNRFTENFPPKISYTDFWMKGAGGRLINEIGEDTDTTVDYLTDSRDSMIINKLADFPVIHSDWLFDATRHSDLRRILMWLFPVGLPLYLWAFYNFKSLRSDIKRVADTSQKIIDLLIKDS